MLVRSFIISVFTVLVASVGTTLSLQAVGADEMPMYKPPVAGAPTRRIGGGSRGFNSNPQKKPPYLAVFAPIHTGYTNQSHPSLYWYVSEVIDKPFIFTLIDAGQESLDENPLVEKKVTLTEAGVQQVNLEKLGVKLNPDVEYQWSLSIILDETQRTTDIVSVGTIQRIPENSDLQQQLATNIDKKHPFVYAQAGLWYDAFFSLEDLIKKYPQEEQRFRQQQGFLLKQVGFDDKVIGSITPDL